MAHLNFLFYDVMILYCQCLLYSVVSPASILLHYWTCIVARPRTAAMTPFNSEPAAVVAVYLSGIDLVQ